ncbi:MAG: aldo/keto reductase [Planctomycetes bacterium]|nr:aldo/keto reductase [Planctomycetota bacterium]
MTEYRTLPNGQAVSTIGLGAVHWHEIDHEETGRILAYAGDNGINLLDFAMAYDTPLARLGPALAGRRGEFVYQMHLGLTFPDGQYARTRDLATVQRWFAAHLRQLGTDYADAGFIHCVDEAEDYEEVFASGVYDYALRLRRDGVLRQVGFATHTIDIAERFLAAGGFDLCLFSLNPAYDFDPVNHLAFEGLAAPADAPDRASRRRAAFYDECRRQGLGIIVMKPFAGGLLLNDRTSPFGQALSVTQCLQYALDRPAVRSAVVGIKSLDELRQAVHLYQASPAERDYAWIRDLRPARLRGTCVYCNHCLPCPAAIDIAAVHRFLDLAEAGDHLAREHYQSLARRASACSHCGACERRCPFGVRVRETMRAAANRFTAT